MDWEEITLSKGNVRQGHFYLPKGTKLFPADSWGGNNKTNKGSQFSVTFSGTGETKKTDIDEKKLLLREARGESKRFIAHHKLKPGDKVFIHKKDEGDFLVATSPPENNTFKDWAEDLKNRVTH